MHCWFDFILAEEGGDSSIFTICAWIEGQNLHEIKFESLDLKNVQKIFGELRCLYNSLAQYLVDKYQKREPVLYDQFYSNGQYMYGSVRGDRRCYIYLVDLDYITLDVGIIGQERYENLFFHCVRNLWEMIERMERKIGQRLRFKKARRTLKEFILAVPETSSLVRSSNFEMTRHFIRSSA